jgi:predicted Ser/Thr protein kinase
MKTIYRKGPNGFVIRNRLPVSRSCGGRTSRIQFLDKDLSLTKNQDDILYVRKSVCKARYRKLVEREIKWLKRLKEFDRTPNFISQKKHSFIMTYSGIRARKSNLPKDWRDQVNYICNKLDEYGCRHNDIKFGEILVKDDKIHLVDFQWATSTHEELKDLVGKNRRWIPNEDALFVKCSIIEEYG